MTADNLAFEVFNETGNAPILLLVEHAGQEVPADLNDLGLNEADKQRHIWYDIGIAPIARQLAKRWDAPCLMSRYSRLLVDLNREPEMDACIPTASDGTQVPANQNLSDDQRAARIDQYFWPYHNQADAMVKQMIEKFGTNFQIISLHSMTHEMRGVHRPWEISVLWEWDDRVARPLLRSLRSDQSLTVGENVPYSARDPEGTSCRWHAARHGIPHVLIELRQDLIEDQMGQHLWGQILAQHFENARNYELGLDKMDTQTKTEIEAAAFRRLVAHFRERTDVQNIDLMNLSGFCRNCLSKWSAAEAKERGVDMSYEEAREFIYGMPYSDWKDKYQQEVTPEQLAKFNATSTKGQS
ncbi:MAG: DUF1244 domain-containing protein [Alphaproteobacteria bacterium]